MSIETVPITPAPSFGEIPMAPSLGEIPTSTPIPLQSSFSSRREIFMESTLTHEFAHATAFWGLQQLAEQQVLPEPDSYPSHSPYPLYLSHPSHSENHFSGILEGSQINQIAVYQTPRREQNNLTIFGEITFGFSRRGQAEPNQGTLALIAAAPLALNPEEQAYSDRILVQRTAQQSGNTDEKILAMTKYLLTLALGENPQEILQKQAHQITSNHIEGDIILNRRQIENWFNNLPANNDGLPTNRFRRDPYMEQTIWTFISGLQQPLEPSEIRKLPEPEIPVYPSITEREEEYVITLYTNKENPFQDIPDKEDKICLYCGQPHTTPYCLFLN